MNFQLRPHVTNAERALPFECVALVLQGGGALGAYQAGVYEALAEVNIHPDWIAGISIGAINAAIIAGNPPNTRVDRLREFWTQATSGAPWDWPALNDGARNLLNQMSANFAAAFGATGFSPGAPSRRGCYRAGRSKLRAFTTPRRSSIRWSAWLILTASMPG